MNLAFSHPLFLFGLAAGILPILIHRLIQRKAVSRDFSAVRLLLQSQKIMSRPHRLKHFLLLALRVLAVSTLALIMARPILMPRGLQAMAADGVKALILDNSLSMGYREERGERFEIAKEAGRKILESFGGQVAVIPTVSALKAASGERENRWMDPDEARQTLDTIPLSYGRGNPGAALSLAYRELRDTMGPKEIVILSDMARGDWEGFDWSKMGVVSGETDVHFFRIGGENRDDNFAVKRLELAEGEAVKGVPSRLEVAVANFSGRDGAPLVQLYLSGVKVDQKKVEVKAGGEGRLSFELFLNRPGWVEGEIRLSGDALPLDDTFYFSLKVRERVRVLLVDGDPGRSLKSSESYYLANALNPGGFDTSAFLSRVVTDEEFAGIELQPYEAVFLLDVAKPPGSRVASFLETGKPVFLFLGDRVIPGEYNRIPLFPWRLGEIRGEGRPERIVQADVRHGGLRDFSGPPGESLKKASIYRYYRIEGATRKLLSLGSQDPLLVEASQEKGRLFLFASSANLDWNDLPLKAAYLPLIQGLLKDAVGLSKDNLPATLRIGDPLEEKLTQVTGPAGGPGVYGFSLGGKEIRRGVNPPLEESDLSKLSGGEIQKRFGTLRVKIWEYREEEWNKGLTGKRELWPFLLGFLLVVLMAEMGVASRT
jgi:hypothetical protein